VSIEAKVLADSKCAETGARVTTFLLTFHRYILAELNTHRVMSRNTASSRAIPVMKMLREVIRNPAVPYRFGTAAKGMQDGGQARPSVRNAAKALWLLARYPAVAFVWLLYKLGIHKQITNRLLEPWCWTTVVLTATEWRNFYRLRYHPAAQPEMQLLAEKMLKAHAESVPQELPVGGWHLPFGSRFKAGVSDLEFDLGQRLKICTARNARTSYVNFYGKNEPSADYRLHDDLKSSGHMSPFEHCCQAAPDRKMYGNFRGFVQYRKTLINEANDDGTPFDPRALLLEIEGGKK
jgi:hypothetical protein